MAAPDKSLSGLLARIHRDHAPGAADEEKVDKSDIVKQVEAQHAAANALLRRVGGESAEPPTVVRIDGGRMRQDQRASGPRPMLGRRLWWRGRASLCPPAVLLHIVAPREEEGRQSKPHRGLRSGASPPKLPLLAAMTRLPARMATLSLSRCRPLCLPVYLPPTSPSHPIRIHSLSRARVPEHALVGPNRAVRLALHARHP